MRIVVVVDDGGGRLYRVDWIVDHRGGVCVVVWILLVGDHFRRGLES